MSKHYGSIFHVQGSNTEIGDRFCSPEQEIIATTRTRDAHDHIIVLEKSDGLNVGVQRTANDITALNRQGLSAIECETYELATFAWWVERNRYNFEDALMIGDQLCGEWMQRAYGTRYNLKNGPFFVFDIFSRGRRLTLAEVEERCRRLPTPNVLHRGREPLSKDEALQRLGDHGQNGAMDRAEGIIWQVERCGEIDFLVKYIQATHNKGAYLSGVPTWNWRPT